MATIYNRLELYCKTNQVEMPELEIRKEIGAIVIAAWFSEENILHKHIPLHKKTFIDESGTTVKVLSYPKKTRRPQDAFAAFTCTRRRTE